MGAPPGGFAPPRVNGDCHAPAVEGALYGRGDLPVRAGDKRVVPPEKYAFGRRLSVIIADHEAAVGQVAYGYPRDKALREARLVPVRGAERVCEPYDVHVVVSSSALPDGDGFGARLFSYIVYFAGYLVQGVVPRKPLPPAFPPPLLPLERVFKAVGVVGYLRGLYPLDAHPPPAHGGFRVALHACDAPVLYVDEYAASSVADPANASDYLFVIVHCHLSFFTVKGARYPRAPRARWTRPLKRGAPEREAPLPGLYARPSAERALTGQEKITRPG